MRARRGAPVEWLLDQDDLTGDECRLWPFGQTHGYGSLRYEGRTWHAHRLICMLVHGQPDAGQTDVAHSCGNRLCCNPLHLRHATASENQRDKISHGTSQRGEQNSSAKLTEGAVRQIKAAIGARSMRELAVDYGVSINAISLIAKGVNWAHVV